MKKDITIPKVEGVGIAIAKEIFEDEENYYAYIINFNDFDINNVLVSSKGYGMKDDVKIKTTTFSHFLDTIPALSFKKIEAITEEVFGISNEFFVTYYIDKLIYDKKYIFLPEVIIEDNFIEIGILDKMGVLIR